MKVAKKKDVAEGVPFCAVSEEKSIALFNVGNRYYAIDNTCTHICEFSMLSKSTPVE